MILSIIYFYNFSNEKLIENNLRFVLYIFGFNFAKHVVRIKINLFLIIDFKLNLIILLDSYYVSSFM